MKIIAIMIMLASLSACSSYGMSSGSSGESAYPMESQTPRNDPSDIYFGG
jgi:hypothetical protein